MRFKLSLWTLVLALLATACQSGPPPTMFVMEVTRVVTVVVSPNPEATAQVDSTAGAVQLTTLATSTPAPTSTEATPTPSISPTPNVFPTPVIGQIYIAEQVFERGRMFWLQPVQQIWVATTDENGDNIWSVYDDTFVDGQPEISPTLTPPAGLSQPERGFGKLWRENPDIQASLGWAVEPEFGHVTRYEYRAGGSVTANNEYVSGPGRHVLTMLDGQVIEFDEQGRTWRILEASQS